MAVTTHHPSLSDTELAARVKELLRNTEVDTQRFDEDLKLTADRIPKLEATIVSAWNQWIVEEAQHVAPLTRETEFARLARLTLERTTITIGIPTPMDRSAHLNGGEVAIVPVTVFNSCGLKLRDIAVQLEGIGPVTVRRYIPGPLRLVNPQYVAELQPGERKSIHFFIQANHVESTLTARLRARLHAEVVPYVARSPFTGAEFEVLPAD